MKTENNQVISQTITKQLDSLAEKILVRQLEVLPRPALVYDEERRETSLQDIKYHLELLAKGIDQANPALFSQYIKWAQELLEQAGQPAEDLADTLRVFRDVLETTLPKDMRNTIRKYLEINQEPKPDVPVEPKSLIDENRPNGKLARRYLDTLLTGDKDTAIDIILNEVEEKKTSVQDIYMKVFQPVMREVGRLWQLDEINIANEHFITQVTLNLMSQIYLYYPESEKKDHLIVAACVSGELHDIGIKMVSDFFEMEGWDAYFLGANTPRECIIEAVREQQADLLCLSASHPMLVSEVETIISAIRAEKDLKNVKILVGGFPFNTEPNLWKEVGADGCAKDAREALRIASSIIRGANE